MSRPPSLAGTGFVSALPERLRRELLARGQSRRFAKGQIIQQRGDRAAEFWYVESGSVQIGRFAVDGRLTMFTLLEAGETFGELAFLGEFARTVDAIAGSESALIRIGDSELQSLMVQDPDVVRLLLKTMALTVQQALDLVESDRNLTVAQRLAQALLQWSGEREDGAKIRVTQQDLADLIGVSRVSAGKAVQRLTRSGAIIAGYGVITIASKNALHLVRDHG